MKKQNGITLIALVITIIVLLILAGVSISMVTGDNGIASKATDAKEKTNAANADEERKLQDALDYIDENVSGGSSADLNDSGIIPEEATYHIGVTSTALGDYTEATTTLTAGNAFPETVNTGDVYVYGDYEYRYNSYSTASTWTTDSTQNGWGVRVLDASKTTYGAILESINGKPVTNLQQTFYRCTALTTAPVIPSSVTDMTFTFSGCTKLTIAPAIPSSVTSMVYTFDGCTALTKAPTIPSSVTSMLGTFSGCTALTTAPVIPSSVTSMEYTFSGCTNLTTAPAIPSSVTDMQYTFSGCTSLTTATVIPNSVWNMWGTFSGCTVLTTAPEIPNSVTNMWSTFSGCTSLTGTITINSNPGIWTQALYNTQITAVIGDTTKADYIMLTKTSTAMNPTA